MKRPIEVMIDVPDRIDGELLELLLYLSDKETALVKGVVTGILMTSDTISADQLSAIHKKYKK